MSSLRRITENSWETDGVNKAELWGLWCDGTCADGASKISGSLRCKWCTVGLSTHWKSNPQIFYTPVSQITYPAVIPLLHKSFHCFHIKPCQSKMWLSSTKSILSPSIIAALSVLAPENCLVSSFHHASADPCLLSPGNSHHLVKHFLAPPWHISICLEMLGIFLTFINKLTYLIFSVIQCTSHAKNSVNVLTSVVTVLPFQLRLQGHYHRNDSPCILLCYKCSWLCFCSSISHWRKDLNAKTYSLRFCLKVVIDLTFLFCTMVLL